jgi:hypothetical protein
MQTKPERGKAAFRTRSVGLCVAILTSAPLIAAMALCAPDQALAGCGVASHPAGVRAAGGGGGVHAASGIAAPSRAGGGGGTLGCANGSSAVAFHGLPVASSGRVIETGARAAHTASRVRTAPTKTTTASAHLHAVKPAHRG